MACVERVDGRGVSGDLPVEDRCTTPGFSTGQGWNGLGNMRSSVRQGWDSRPGTGGLRRRGHAGSVPARARTALPIAVAALAVVAALSAGACDRGSSSGADDALTGRVMSKTDQGYCVSADRGETTDCVPLDRAADEAEVVECGRVTDAATPADARLTVVDESACAAGDLGDDAPDR